MRKAEWLEKKQEMKERRKLGSRQTFLASEDLLNVSGSGMISLRKRK